jgi:3-dehydroquinate dehydratase II
MVSGAFARTHLDLLQEVAPMSSLLVSSPLPSVLILNGPNLNLLGRREPEIYGTVTLEDIGQLCLKTADALGLHADFRQSNHEGELVGILHEAIDTHAAVIINAAAYTHTSVVIHDALKLFPGPVIEVHLSNIFAREAFRHQSFVSPVATGVICGLGAQGYALALQAVKNLLDRRHSALS